jgi:hypothetical protein
LTLCAYAAQKNARELSQYFGGLMSWIVFRAPARPFFAHKLCWLFGAIVIGSVRTASADDIMATKAPAISYSNAAAYNWSGFYAGVHLGVAWGRSNWTEQPDGLGGSFNLFQRPDAFSEFGSWFGGIQAGYD